MPIYEYECRKCGKRFEKLVPRAGTPVACEACGSADVQKQFSVFAATAPANTACGGREHCPAAAPGGCGCGGGCCHHHH